ncbi:uncharacterized protein LOC143244943 [Tachypleus tridentatus]|uniref:uncharacterized protein LOC143244943 n=1 Tax=Tachypleus tridentatus TaxID=6853 RepID=UPI003FD2B31E
MKLSLEANELQFVYLWITLATVYLGCVTGKKSKDILARRSEVDIITQRPQTTNSSVVSMLMRSIKTENGTDALSKGSVDFQSTTIQDERLRIDVVALLKSFMKVIQTEIRDITPSNSRHTFNKRCHRSNKRRHIHRRQHGGKHRKRRRNKNRSHKPRSRRRLSSIGALFGLKSDSPAMVVTTTSHLQKDWCQTKPMRQEILENGCIPAEISNNFCYGQCNSFFIPKPGSDPKDDNSGAFRSCPFCKPRKVHWITVVLRCPSLTPPIRIKQVMRIEKCRCISYISQ